MKAYLVRALILVGVLEAFNSRCLSEEVVVDERGEFSEIDAGDENGEGDKNGEDDGFGTVAGSLVIASDYMFRSISNSNNGPTVQGDLNWTHDIGFYIGVWTTNTDFGGPGNSMEFDPYVGWSGDLPETEINLNIGYWSYNYPKSEFDFDYAETYLTLSFTVDKLTISPSLWYSNNYFGRDFLNNVDSLAYEATFSLELASYMDISVHLGEQTFESSYDHLNYGYYDAGIDWKISDYTLGLRWYDTDGVDPFLAAKNLTDGRFVFKVTRSF
ncbi:TorF family putative porin [Microbulbifer sp. DLAB2-AA]|uniref:TorF family putative porin n=1 Tax=Microbulbifer sp. DLAB2-AA TaxID=3243394 RepID=UPI00403A7986